MNNIMDDLSVYLQDYYKTGEFVLVEDENLFSGYEPKDPDNCIILADKWGSKFAAFTHTNVRNIQVQSRNRSNRMAEAAAWKILEALNPLDSFIKFTNSGVIALAKPRQGPVRLGEDAEGRHTWMFHVAITYNYK